MLPLWKSFLSYLVITICFNVTTLVCFASESGSSLANGLGDNINWVTLDDGLKHAKEEGKPIMLIIHKSWCGACKSLTPQIAASKEIHELSKHFVMVNTVDDDEPNAEPGNDKFTPDGGYVPRVLFYDPNGNLLRDEIHKNGNPQYKYFYHDADSIVTTMKRVIEKLKPNKEDSSNTNPEDASIDLDHSEL